jgi:hypothetical protein
MLKNLLKTWWILAPDEVAFGEDHKHLFLRKNTEEHGLCAIGIGLRLCYEQDALQGYLQRCIHARNWYFSLQQVNDYSKADVRSSIEADPRQIGKYTDACYEVLLAAYLAALAAQRPVKTGLWRHFKGSVMEVKAVASPTDSGIPVNICMGIYTLEDAPEQTVILGDQGKFSTSYWDYKNRVFYQNGGRGWARTTEDFLGLVGADHPEHEGLLRFVEVSSAGVE